MHGQQNIKTYLPVDTA